MLEKRTKNRSNADQHRNFAFDVVKKLQDKGFIAYWAGGCVRDSLLGQIPKDYDVATNATPEEIQKTFGRSRTLTIGAAFGVITVLDPPTARQVEVATFRSDSQYSDGRHPDAVAFSDPREDALRRDFTVNGMFFDPITNRIYDYVGGREDLQSGVIRAIGDPEKRINEDKLRMLRAVRFTAAFDFHLDKPTAIAITAMAREIHVVSAERITAEMRRMLTHSSRSGAMQLLKKTDLLRYVFSEACASDQPTWQRIIQGLSHLSQESFPLSIATILNAAGATSRTDQLYQRWKLANAEKDCITWLLKNMGRLWSAHLQNWSSIQPILTDPRIDQLIDWHQAVAKQENQSLKGVEYCQTKLQLPRNRLDPQPLLTGNDLSSIGIPPGPMYGTILGELRSSQLDGLITNFEEAIQLAKHIRSNICDSE